ncbi:hypothetical protein [Acidisphaera sp. L21]|uniref:hypothetical protein n=1 Tax=Acidisphaera sp. L21 TaxID=1641851 RepID=UPI00131D8575|nr:hypothetical protein [Acidisphaera sp. L21]
MFRAALPALLVLLAGCTSSSSSSPSAVNRSNVAAVASCRASTNQAFDRQNRYLISERDQTASPFSMNGNPGVTTRGLTDKYDYDNALQSCLAASSSPQNANTAATVSGGAPVR